MHHTTPMHKVDPEQDLREKPCCLSLCESVVRHLGGQRSQRTSRAILENHVDVSFILEMAEQSQDVAVMQLGLYTDLSLQLRQHVSDEQWGLLNDLQSHPLTSLPMTNSANRCIGTFAEQLRILLELCRELWRELLW
jgi:hypothetical protein